MSRLSLACLGLAAALPAQTSLTFPDNLPGSGGCNVIPFGNTPSSLSTWGNQKYQTLLTASQLGNVPRVIADIGFAPCATGQRTFKTIRIQLGYTKGSTLSTTFASNLANAQTVLDSKDYVWHHTSGQWNRIGLQKQFIYIPANGNLVIDVEVTGANLSLNSSSSSAGMHSASLVRMYKYGWTTPPTTGTLSSSAGLKWELVLDAADLALFGLGCKGSAGVPELALTGSAKVNGKFTVDLDKAPASSAAIVLLGLSNNLPLPVDLAGLGAPGCRLYVSPDYAFGLPTSGSGKASMPWAVPNDRSLARTRLYYQYLPLDKQANQLGFTVSNYGRVLIGL